MAQLTFFVRGKPVPKQSFKIGKAYGHGYTPKHVLAWASTVKSAAYEHYTARPITNSLAVVLTFYLPTRKRVDLDNLSKAVLDALNGVVWEDDRQVVDLHVRKYYHPSCPGVHVNVQRAQDFGEPPGQFVNTQAINTLDRGQHDYTIPRRQD